jgi:hypothetical protein
MKIPTKYWSPTSRRFLVPESTFNNWIKAGRVVIEEERVVDYSGARERRGVVITRPAVLGMPAERCRFARFRSFKGPRMVSIALPLSVLEA